MSAASGRTVNDSAHPRRWPVTRPPAPWSSSAAKPVPRPLPATPGPGDDHGPQAAPPPDEHRSGCSGTVFASGWLEDEVASDKPGGVIWLRPEHAATGRPARRSREEITAAAIAIADREGLGAVSMRRVAAGLGTGAAS